MDSASGGVAPDDVAAGAGSDAGDADNVENDEVIRSYYAAVEKLGPPVRVRVSDMRFSTVRLTPNWTMYICIVEVTM